MEDNRWPDTPGPPQALRRVQTDPALQTHPGRRKLMFREGWLAAGGDPDKLDAAFNRWYAQHQEAKRKAKEWSHGTAA